MAATEVTIGYGTTVEVHDGDSPGTYVNLGELTGEIGQPQLVADQHEATHNESPGRMKEYVQGMIEPGEMPLTMNYIPGGVTDLFILEWQASGENRNVRINLQPEGIRKLFVANVQTYGPKAPINGVKTADLTLKVAGAVTQEVITP